MLITELFKHKQVHVENKICSQSWITVFFQQRVGYCSVRRAVDGTHCVRNLISDVAHQDHNSVMSDFHYRAYSFDLYLELWSIFQLFHHPWSRKPLKLSIQIFLNE